MSSFSFTGAISGLDTQSLLSALVSAERLPLTRLAAQRTAMKSTQTAYGDLRSLLAKLESAAKAFSKDLAGAKRTASSSSASILAASAGASALPATYNVVVNRLATSTVARSSAAMGTPIGEAQLDTALSALNLPGSVTSGSVGMIVDGHVVRATIGDPSTTTLRQALTAIGDALTTQVRANEGPGSTATVTAEVVDNRVRLTLAGTAATHAVAFGVGGDTSNALGVLGFTGTGSVDLSSATPMTGRSAVGVTQTSVALDAAGLTGLASKSDGVLTLNGVAIAYDTTVDTINTLVTRINGASAGVVASLDRTNDRLVLTAKGGGSAPIAIEDNGSLAAALRIPPGTPQELGQQAQVTIDGVVSFADTNKVTTVIPGVTLTLLAEGTSTITVNPDESAMTSAVQDLVNAYNALADKLDTLTQNDPKGTRGALAGESDVRSLSLSLRRTLTSSFATSGAYRSFADLGVTTGRLGSAAGTTDRLSIDAAKLKAAIEADPTAVADLLNGANGLIAPLTTAVGEWTKSGGRIDRSLDAIGVSLKQLDVREEQLQARIDKKTAALEARFAAMERTLAELQTTSNSLGSTVNQMSRE